jgi:septal ring factor EnvC (AmiA/AmiB activator)
MAIDSDSQRNSGQRWLRSVASVVGVVAVAGVIYLGFILHESGPNYYQPARVALVSAQRQLAESYSHEKALIEQLHTVHSELDAAMADLEKAESLDHADKREIETMRVRLQALEDARQLSHTTPEQLQESYQGLTAQLDALINRLERSTPKP